MGPSRAIGRDWEDLPSDARDFDRKTEFDLQILEEGEATA